MPHRPAPLYYPALTGIRALAAYLVYAHHFNPFPAWSGPWRLANEGHMGVTMFFVLSGFLITTRYFGLTSVTRAWAGRYFRNRLARIYPLYCLLTVITLLAFELNPALDGTGAWPGYSPADKAAAVLTNLTLTRGLFTEFLSSGIMQGWTLTVEESFYCLAPLLLVALARSRAPYRLLLAATLVSIGLGIALVYGSPAGRYGFFADYRFMAYRTFFGRTFEFMVGVGLAVFMRRPPAARSGFRFTGMGAAWVGASVLGLALLSTEQTFSWNRWSGIALNNLLLPIGIGGLFYGLLTERTWLSRLLATPVAQRLGKSSYAFYLVHMGIFSLALQRYVTTKPGLQFIALLGLSLALYQYVELPLHRVIRRGA
ncbi:acyltransferase family protein [Hymenobacter chitinivorans]|uniref:Peptidoglycan/LPS O-acetylase OafA/YrhL n=1 Tax=Hymenobacter chitinivorans DSM 11115 TaxID=1121954 RepID=A0A2M9BTE3_9BACT|nr:acyltransferase [Hymenobacter chitinivorans]PJJ61228.1 peptidoglycan/LPS O-acetylase OafA/YrhL [Hymenobacter chitinivorans DSM 11115]